MSRQILKFAVISSMFFAVAALAETPAELRTEAQRNEALAKNLERTNKPLAVKFGNSNVAAQKYRDKAQELYAEADKAEATAVAENPSENARARMKDGNE